VNNLTPYNPLKDPATILGFPPMLPVELAMHVDTPQRICAAYGIDFAEFAELTQNPVFQLAYNNAVDELKKDGVSFRLKAKMQAEKLLEKSWQLIHDVATPTTVQADLIKSTVRWAGYDATKTGEVGIGNTFAIQINLGDTK
jgi:hypothetical protein